MEKIIGFNFRKILLNVLVLGCLISCTKEQEGKHLFILSGQSNMVGLKPNESFHPAVNEFFGEEQVLVVKDAKGAQPIWQWYKDWESPTSFQPQKKGVLYDRLLQKVNATKEREKVATVTFIWMQGERDARKENGDVYEASLKGLYRQLSADLKRSDVNFIIGRLNDFDMQNEKYPHWIKIREAQVTVGNSNPRFAWVNTDDLNDGVNRKGKQIHNDLHMSVEGYKILGQRFAEKAIQLIQKSE